MTDRHVRILWAFGVLLCANALSAANLSGQEPDSVVMRLERIVVTATRSNRTVGDVSAAVTVLDASDLRLSGSSTVGDVLRSIPGISTLRQFSTLVGHPSTQAVVLRGIGGSASSRTLVLLDGQPIVDPFSGWMNWDRVPMDVVERIEVVRGGTAGIWGNRALGGVVNVITRNPAESRVQITAQGGGLGTWKGAAYGAYAGGSLSLTGFAEHAGTDGYITTRPDQRGPVDVEQWTKHRTYMGKASWSSSAPVTVDVDGSYYDWEAASGTPSGASTMEIGTLRARVRVRTDNGNVWSFAGHGGVQTFTNYFASSSVDRKTETPASNQFDVPATTLGFNAHWARPARGRHELSAGADVEWTEGETNEEYLYRSGEFTRGRQAGGEQLLAGAYLQDAFAATDAFELFASGRLNLWRSMGGSRTETDLGTGETLLSENAPSQSTFGADFNMGFRHALTSVFDWRASVFTGFRAPTLNELHRPFRSPGNVVGAPNAELKPERLVGFELGGDLAVSSKAAARATVFWNQINDAIGDATIEVTGDQAKTIEPCGRVPANGVCRQRDNFGTIRSMGIETEFEVRPNPAWGILLSHTYNPTQVRDTDSRPDLEGLWVRRIPRHQLLARVNHVDPRFIDVSLTSRYLGSMFDDDRNTGRIDASFLVDVRASRRLSEIAELFLTIENLLGVDNEVALSTSGLVRLGLPRLVQGGFRIDF